MQARHLLFDQRHLLRRELFHEVVVLQRGDGSLLRPLGEHPGGVAFLRTVSGGFKDLHQPGQCQARQHQRGQQHRAGDDQQVVARRERRSVIQREGQCQRKRQGGETAHPAPGQDQDFLGRGGLQQVLPCACRGRQEAEPQEPDREHDDAHHHGGADHAVDLSAFIVDDLADFQPHQPEGQAGHQKFHHVPEGRPGDPFGGVLRTRVALHLQGGNDDGDHA
ncbi:hypothetical protein D9M72_447000 [compost metagenome]